MREYVLRVYHKTQEDNLPYLAASISFFAMFSLFPLVLFLIAGTGYFFAAERQAEAFVLAYVGRALPQFLPLVRETIHTVIATRGQATVVGSVVLLGAGTAVFDALEYALSFIWGSRQRNIWFTKLIGITAVIALGFALLLMTVADPVLRASRELLAATSETVGISPVIWSNALVLLSTLLVTVGILWLMYRFVPNAKVSSGQAAVAAVFAAVMWEIAKRIFSIYLAAAANFSRIYGSLGIIVGLMFWLYVTSMIVLIGAELAVGMATGGQPGNRKPGS